MPLLGEQLIERLRLRDRARKAVENEALLDVGFLQAVVDDRDHDLVRDEVAARHDVFGLQADRRFRLHRRAQHVAGRETGNAVPLDQAIALRALAWHRAVRAGQASSPRPAQLRLLDQAFILVREQMPCICATVSIVTETTIRSDVPPK